MLSSSSNSPEPKKRLEKEFAEVLNKPSAVPPLNLVKIENAVFSPPKPEIASDMKDSLA